MNTVSLIGRLTADPEIRYFESGKSVSKFSIAVNRTKEEADFFEIEAWEKTAEVVSQYCRKGSQVGISGSLIQERWQDKTTGGGRSKVVVRAARVELLGSKPDDEASSYTPAPVETYVAAPAQTTAAAPTPSRRPATSRAPQRQYAPQATAAAVADSTVYDDIPF